MLRIRNVQLPDGQLADILIEGLKIKRIEPATTYGEGIDATDLIAIPGVIDPHVHFRDFEEAYKEDWRTGSQAALNGGTTTVFDMPNTKPPLTSLQALKEKRGLVKDESLVGARFWFGATPDNLAEIIKISKMPDIVGVKVFMGSSTGSLLIDNEDDLKRIFEVCAKCGLVCALHAEDETLIKRNLTGLYKNPQIAYHADIRNIAVNLVAEEKAFRINKNIGCKLYICHVTTPEGVEMAQEAKASGQTVYVEVTPHHILLTRDKLEGDKGGFFKMNPALRGKDVVEKLLRYVCEGPVDVIGSDHAPHTIAEKAGVIYEKVPSGVPGTETLLPAMLDLVSKEKMTIKRLVSLTSARAAEIFNLQWKGKLEPGYDADITLVSLKRQMRVRGPELATKCKWSPFQGRTFTGIPVMTIIGGKIMN